MNKYSLFLQAPKTKIGMFIICFLLAMAILAPIICPGNPLFSVDQPLLPPSSAHYFGTDDIGADVFVQVVWGSRVSIFIAFCSAGISLILGTLLGSIAGYAGGTVDNILSRFFEMFYTIPRTFLAILLVAIFGSSISLVMLVIGLTIWPSNAKLMRAQVLSLKKRDYVDAAKITGGSGAAILFAHIIPNSIGPVLSNSTLQMAQAVLTEASISFLGLGDPNLASWGKLLQAGQKHISSAPWLVVIPGIFIALLILSFNFISESLNENLSLRRYDTV
ncbi:MAG: ABC transporter permease [Eubacteriales bacterium]|nr:ABC transporter permease [Clostridiales bacterium]MDY5835644.1 ABC transporter permease [Eubacteriales bacterium]